MARAEAENEARKILDGVTKKFEKEKRKKRGRGAVGIGFLLATNLLERAGEGTGNTREVTIDGNPVTVDELRTKKVYNYGCEMSLVGGVGKNSDGTVGSYVAVHIHTGENTSEIVFGYEGNLREGYIPEGATLLREGDPVTKPGKQIGAAKIMSGFASLLVDESSAWPE